MRAPLPFFWSAERLAALDAAAQAWIGTPFAHNGRVRGSLGGACCHGLTWGVLEDAGFRFGEAMPLGQASHARHSREEIILPWLRMRCGVGEPLMEVTPATASQLMPGDITTHRLGLCTHHVALVLPGRFLLETWSRRVAGVRTLDDADATKRMTAVFRPLDIAPHA